MYIDYKWATSTCTQEAAAAVCM